MKDISIVIPAYNASETIKACIDSVVKNVKDANLSYEIIVVDDGSNDGSFEYLSERLKHNDKMKLSRNPINRGIGSVRNALLSMASGKYILFVDPDDYIETLLLEELDKYYNLDLDIKTKLTLCLTVDKILYTKFIRNENQTTNKVRPTYRKR